MLWEWRGQDRIIERFATGLYVLSYKPDDRLAQVWMLARKKHLENGNIVSRLIFFRYVTSCHT